MAKEKYKNIVIDDERWNVKEHKMKNKNIMKTELKKDENKNIRIQRLME